LEIRGQEGESREINSSNSCQSDGELRERQKGDLSKVRGSGEDEGKGKKVLTDRAIAKEGVRVSNIGSENEKSRKIQLRLDGGGDEMVVLRFLKRGNCPKVECLQPGGMRGMGVGR
jgi:hypothetical protein